MDKDKYPGKISGPILMSLVTLGPIGGFIIDFLSGEYDRLLMLFVVSLGCTILSTIFWMDLFRPSRWEVMDEDIKDTKED